MKSLTLFDQLLLVWLAIANVWTFLQFGLDKWFAGRSRERTPESTLLLLCAFGGWPAGFLAMTFFRHKIAKPAFVIKFAGTFVVWAALLWGAVKWQHF
ncbi:MAG TPA: DUF1294 domain-containing protein [Opitutaceae bacterium]|nr:DUF1294 domain-containing protein [Opitutaceae bacterium]